MSLHNRIAQLRTRNDAGAALILALVFITIVAIAVAAMLAFADTSLRTTIALRSQASGSSEADGAAQIAIDQLRLGSYAGTGNCFGTSTTVTLSNFYKAPGSSTSDSAVVDCAQDTVNSQAANTGTKPAYALLTLGNDKDSHGRYIEDGIDAEASGDNHYHDRDNNDHEHDNRNNHNHSQDALISFQGSIGSKSDIQIDDHATVDVTGDVKAAQCDDGIDQTGTETCTSSAANALSDPNYAAPPAPTTGTPSMPSCAAYMKFTPGIYSSVSTLNNLMNCSKAVTFDFRPGIYYFDFSGDWTISRGTLVAGAANPLSSKAPSIPGACASPVPPNTPDPSTNGVEFVFGGSAQMSVTNDANVEICGIYSATSPAIAIYGLKSSIGSGSNKIPAQSGCVIDDNYEGSDPCAFIQTDSNHSDDVDFFVQGMVYAPNAWVDLDLTDSVDQHFDDGMVVRAFSVTADQNSRPPTVISVPTGGSSATRTVVLLTVYVCPGKSTCTTSTGRVRLRAKVGINDPTGAAVPGKREITVYDWSVQR